MPAPSRGLQGGTAPARAFHDFMAVAVANRPAEQFDTQVPIPDWQLTPEEEMYGDAEVDANAVQPMVDENGMPIGMPPAETRAIRSSSRWSAPTAPASRASRTSTALSRRSSRSGNRRSRQQRSPSASARRRGRPQTESSAAGRPVGSAALRGVGSLSPRQARAEQLRLERLELRSMIEMPQMRDLVRDNVAPRFRRCEDQPPA